MENNYFESIMTGLNESLEYAKGDKTKARSLKIIVAEIPNFHQAEVKRIRENLGLSQRNFAFVMGISPKTVEAWESGRNTPQGIAQRFLQMLDVGGEKILQECNVISKQVGC